MSAKSDALFYLKNRKKFSFSPRHDIIFLYSKDGIDGIKAFIIYDSVGTVVLTKHPRIANSILKTKESLNFSIKQWAYGCACGYTIPIEIKDYLDSINAPEWIFKAVQALKWKIYFNSESVQREKIVSDIGFSNVVLTNFFNYNLKDIKLFWKNASENEKRFKNYYNDFINKVGVQDEKR
jgi:hypothetical protein